MNNIDEFVIKDGILKMYTGPGGDVVIPEGVTCIGFGAFSNCSDLTSVTIPNGVTSIDENAFYACNALTSVTIPNGVTSIGDWAFADCSALTNVTIPEGVTSLGNFAFHGCIALTSVTIPNGVTSIGIEAFFLCNTLTSVTIPEGVTCIGNGAFACCNSLTSVTIPDSVTCIGKEAFMGTALYQQQDQWENGLLYMGNHLIKAIESLSGAYAIKEGTRSIGSQAFYKCSDLTSVTIPSSVTNISDGAFEGCVKLQWVKSPLSLNHSIASGCGFPLLLRGKKPGYYAYSAKADCDNLSDFAVPGKWNNYDLELMNNGPAYKYKLPTRLLGALGRLLDPVELTEECRAALADLLNKNVKKLIPLAEEMEEPDILSGLLSLQIMDEKTEKTVRKLMVASSVPEIAALANEKPHTGKTSTQKPTENETAANDVQTLLQAEYAAKYKAAKGDAVIKKMKLLGAAMPGVKLTDGNTAPAELFRFLLVSYGVQKDYHFAPEADEAAKLLSYDSLCDAMDAVSGHLDGPNYPAVLPLLCRYGNAKQIRALTIAWKSWGDWQSFGQKGRNAQSILHRALMLSDTREAVAWLEKNGGLYDYAALRGISVPEVYERYLFDFGLDEHGKRIFDLGTTQIEATLTDSLQLALLNTASGKPVKMIPKKGIDPAVQKKAADELADMRQTLKSIRKIKTDQLFADYLEGTMCPAETWQRRYQGNYFVRKVAELLVWDQAGRCFRLTDDGPVGSNGLPCEVGEESIKLAHPMEMKPEEVTAWQKHFTEHGLKQPFQQIWEPVYDYFGGAIRADRYQDCRIDPVYLKNQGRRGIECEWYDRDYYGSKYLRIRGFLVSAKDAPWQEGDKREHLMIYSLRPERWNRRANNVIAFLDRITMYDRIKKDDVSVMELMDRFTLAQVTEFIKAAQEANAVNVLAALMDYKNTHFAEFDPMDEFVLE